MFNKNRVQKYALFPTGSIPTNKDFASMFCEVDNARQEVFDCVFPNRLTRGNDAFSSSRPRLPVRQMFVVTNARPHFAQRKRPSLVLLPAHLLCLIICQKRWINNAAIQSSAGT